MRKEIARETAVRRCVAGVATLVAVVVLTGCASLSGRSVAYVGVARYAATPVAAVEILHADPERGFEKLGEVVVETSLSPAPAIEKVEARLRTEAAKLGADAVVLVRDQTYEAGAVVMGPWWSSTVSPIHGRQIVAIAIKYK